MTIIQRAYIGLERKPFRVLRRFVEDDIAAVECEASFWEGPWEPGQIGRFELIRWIERAGRYGFDPATMSYRFIPRRKTTCSYEGELARALA